MNETIHIDGSLRIDAGQATSSGEKPANEDCMGLRLPEGIALTMKGVAAVIADGVSSAEAGREASESCVQSFLNDYYSTPESWSVRNSAQAVLIALNRWLYSRGHGMVEAHKGYVSTLSALILKSHTAHLFHVGDTRIHRIRDNALEQLTRDHVTQISEKDTYLSRAVGMDVRLEVDYRALELQAGDIFLLTTDGVHDFVDASTLVQRIAHGSDLEAICQDLIGIAQAAGSIDNLTCQLVRVQALPPEDANAVHRRLTQLPFPPPLEPGMKVDGHLIEKEIHASNRSQLYLVTDTESKRRLVMKTPSVNFEDDPAYIERFVMEPWIGRRVANRHVVEIVESERRQSFLYYLMEYVDGPTLRQWIDEHRQPEIVEVLAIVDQLAAGLQAFHRKETLHQDLKPENIVFDCGGVLKIVDFGSCQIAGIQEIAAPIERDHVLGTARYSAPEVRIAESAGIRSEIFSFGTLVYEMLTHELPYGEKIENANSQAAFERLKYVPSHHRNPMVPVWMDGALRTAVSIPWRRRYRELSELLYDLRHPNATFLRTSPRPLIERDPLRFWKGLALLLCAAWLTTLWFWLTP